MTDHLWIYLLMIPKAIFFLFCTFICLTTRDKIKSLNMVINLVSDRIQQTWINYGIHCEWSRGREFIKMILSLRAVSPRWQIGPYIISIVHSKWFPIASLHSCEYSRLYNWTHCHNRQFLQCALHSNSQIEFLFQNRTWIRIRWLENSTPPSCTDF